MSEVKKRGSAEIQAFVQATLISIYDAVTETNYTRMSEGPHILVGGGGPFGGRPKPINQVEFDMPKSVKFDIAITASEDTSVSGGLDLKIAKIGSDVSGAQSMVNRVEFEIPVSAQRRTDER